jgi:hypothetical protein
MMNSIRVIAATGALLALLSITACVSAQENHGADDAVKHPTRFDQACNIDIEKFCSNVLPGDGRIASCLYAHTDVLDDACFEATSQIGVILEDIFDYMEAFWIACQSDLNQVCQGVETGGGRVIDCLQENQMNISAGCNAAMPGVKGSGR